MGNRTSETINGILMSYTVDDNDRLINRGTTSYTYDDNGNTLTESDGTTTTNSVYDSRNRLVGSDAGGAVISMGYDPAGLRIEKTVDGELTEYLVDTNRDYGQVLFERTGATELGYTFGTDLVILDTQAGIYIYHTDALSSTRLLTDSIGQTADTVNYDAWGELLDGGSVIDNHYLYTGEQFDIAVGNYYLRARYYDHDLARFTQIDAWLGADENPNSLNKYNYSESDPVNNTDPSGYCTVNSNSLTVGRKAEQVISDLYDSDHPDDRAVYNRTFQAGIPAGVSVPRAFRYVRPDILNPTKETYAEIKPLSLSGISKGKTQMAIYSSIAAFVGYSRESWDPVQQSVTICGEISYVKNIEGILFYTNDTTIRTLVAEAATLAIISKINRSSKTPSKGFGKHNRAISLLNRASSISASYARNSVRTAISNSLAIGLSFGF